MKFNNFFKFLTYAEVLSFGSGQRNRKVKSNHVNDFYNALKDIKEKKYTIYSEDGDGTYLVFGLIPIIINPLNGHILDGQHRLEAFIKAYYLGIIDDNARIAVAYWKVEDEEIENALIIDLNSKSKNWSVDDYMDCFAQYKDYYLKLKDFCSRHELCMTFSKQGDKTFKFRYAAAMLTGKGQASTLKSGNFSFTDEDLKMGDTIHKELCQIRKKLKLPMVGNDIEAMAIEWYKQRNFISLADIKSLYYVPADVKNMSIKNKKDWRDAFCRLKDAVQKCNLKKVA